MRNTCGERTTLASKIYTDKENLVVLGSIELLSIRANRSEYTIALEQ
jgi:hypothetical protein